MTDSYSYGLYRGMCALLLIIGATPTSLTSAQSVAAIEVRQLRVLGAANAQYISWVAFERLYDTAERNYQQVKQAEGTEVFRDVEAAAVEGITTTMPEVAVRLAQLGVRKASERAFLNVVGLALTAQDIAKWLPLTARLTKGYWENRMQVMQLRALGARVEAAGQAMHSAVGQAHPGDGTVTIHVATGGFAGQCTPSFSGMVAVRVMVATGGRTSAFQTQCQGGNWTVRTTPPLRGTWGAYAVLSDGRNAVGVSGTVSGDVP